MLRYFSYHCVSPRYRSPLPRRGLYNAFRRSGFAYPHSSTVKPTKMATRNDGGADMSEFVGYMEKLKNYERSGVPKDAGTDSDEGFDLGRMRRLLRRLGDPHLSFKAVHVAGTKGKGSTLAFLSSILREEGYSVGCYTSPHLMTIRERISFGKFGEHVSATMLTSLLHKIKGIIDHSMELENGAQTHFEVFTAIAFTLFSQEKVEIVIIEAGLGGARDATNVLTSTELTTAIITTIGEEHLAALGGSLESIAMAKAGIIKQGRPLIIGGPFEHDIESILRDKASSMNSPVVSASDPGIKSIIKSYRKRGDKLIQICDIFINVKKDLPLYIELCDLNLSMLGDHQLQNAVTATCAALCLCSQGWRISYESIHVGLERTILPGRCQFLTKNEIESIGLSGVSVLIDGAHTEVSASSLAGTVTKIHSNESVALVVAMATDKDHASFLRALISGLRPDVVLLTEVSIAGSKSRMTPASSLKNSCVQCAMDLGIDVTDIGEITHTRSIDSLLLSSTENRKGMLIGRTTTEFTVNSMKAANELLKSITGSNNGLIVVTGSLHIVSSVLASIVF